MTRRKFLLLSTLAVACTRSSKSIAESFPRQVGEWNLQETKVLPAEEAPALIRSLGLRSAALGRYGGQSGIIVRVYQMNAEASAFELIQKWRRDQALVLYKGPYFMVAESEGQDRGSLMAFLQTFQQQFHAP